MPDWHVYSNPQGSEAAKPKWYVMDEFGSRIRHSDTPNFRVVPFFYAGAGLAYSIMWPIKEVMRGGMYGIRIILANSRFYTTNWTHKFWS